MALVTQCHITQSFSIFHIWNNFSWNSKSSVSKLRKTVLSFETQFKYTLPPSLLWLIICIFSYTCIYMLMSANTNIIHSLTLCAEGKKEWCVCVSGWWSCLWGLAAFCMYLPCIPFFLALPVIQFCLFLFPRKLPSNGNSFLDKH